MRKTALLLVFSLISVMTVPRALGQKEHRVKMNLINGVKLKGVILDSFNDIGVRLNVDDSNTLVIRYDLIRKIVFKGYGTIRNDFEKKLTTPPSLKLNTFFHEIRGNLLFGTEDVSVGLHTINGYQFSQYLGTGLGVGLNKFGNYLTVPLYASVKGYLLNRKTAPFYFGDIGYGFAWKTDKNDDVFTVDKMRGGLYWQIGLGYQINFYNSALVFTFGYVNQDSRMEYIYDQQWWGRPNITTPDQNEVTITEERLLRRFVFSVGFLL